MTPAADRVVLRRIEIDRPWRDEMQKLMVNIDHVATLREARGVSYPDPVYAAGIAEDGRRIGDNRAPQGRPATHKGQGCAASQGDRADKAEPGDGGNGGDGRDREGLLPDMATLVPEKRQELTTEGGLDVAGNRERIATRRGAA